MDATFPRETDTRASIQSRAYVTRFKMGGENSPCCQTKKKEAFQDCPYLSFHTHLLCNEKSNLGDEQAGTNSKRKRNFVCSVKDEIGARQSTLKEARVHEQDRAVQMQHMQTSFLFFSFLVFALLCHPIQLLQQSIRTLSALQTKRCNRHIVPNLQRNAEKKREKKNFCLLWGRPRFLSAL